MIPLTNPLQISQLAVRKISCKRNAQGLFVDSSTFYFTGVNFTIVPYVAGN